MQTFFEYCWSDMYCLATMVVLMTFFGCLFAHHSDLRQRMVGARMRIACCSLIYRKVVMKVNSMIDNYKEHNSRLFAYRKNHPVTPVLDTL